MYRIQEKTKKKKKKFLKRIHAQTLYSLLHYLPSRPIFEFLFKFIDSLDDPLIFNNVKHNADFSVPSNFRHIED